MGWVGRCTMYGWLGGCVGVGRCSTLGLLGRWGGVRKNSSGWWVGCEEGAPFHTQSTLSSNFI